MKFFCLLVLSTVAVISIANAFECEEEGDFQDPKNCSNYIVCDKDKNIAGTMTCGPDLYFDEYRKVCDYPANVKCKNSKKLINRIKTKEPHKSGFRH
uniref:Chitinase n=1 Tax=Hadrurus spadix TaxID=141984 RepID=A0A1W7RAT4_9SCOR